MATVIFGAGGHGKVVADILVASGVPVLGFLDASKRVGDAVLGLPVLGDEHWLDANRADVALGIGDNARRAAIAERILQRGSRLVSAIHPRAAIAISARIGDGVVVPALAVVNPDADVGRGAIVNTGAVVEHDCEIGAFAHLATNVATGGGCHIGEQALIGSNATILPLRRVGARAVVGSGSVVTKNVEDDAVVVGVPARPMRR